MDEATVPAKPESSANSKVPPTAWGVAYLRTFTDTPFTAEIFKILEDRRKAQGTPDFAEEMKRAPLAPQLEARYKLVDRLVRAQSADQILEVASGLAPRGVNFALSDPHLRYVEVDLPEMATQKRDILSHLDISLPGNLEVKDGDALSFDDLVKAVAGFTKDRSIVVVNEGLMRYLNFDQKATLAQNVKRLLQEFYGAWVTPDISLRSS